MIRPSTVFQCYRKRLERLAPDSWHHAVLEFATSKWCDLNIDVRWTRSFARFDPDREPYVTVLLESTEHPEQICLVEVFSHRPVSEETGLIGQLDPGVGWIQVRRFPDDPKLVGLARVIASVDCATVLRYRPYKRCTIRVDVSNREAPLFAKVFADSRGKHIHDQSFSLWEASRRQELGFQVAKPNRWDENSLTIWQGGIQGRPLCELLYSRKGVPIAERIGKAAATLPRSNLNPRICFDDRAQLHRSRKSASTLGKRLPDLIDSLQALMTSLERAHTTSSSRKLYPVHGAPHAHQWLLQSDNQLGLVDFDRLCRGNRELDAATFVAEVDFEDRRKVPVDELIATFLEAYQNVAGKLDQQLFNAYRSHKRLAKALRASGAVHPDSDAKVRRHLVFAHACLASNPE